MPNSIEDYSQEMVEVLPRVMRGVMRWRSDALLSGKITPPQFLALNLIFETGPLRMTDVAADLKVSLPAVSGMVERLCRLGLVRRQPGETDRRIIRVELTLKGRELIKKARSQREETFSRIFRRLSEEDRKSYLRIMRRIKEMLESGELNEDTA